MTPAVELVDFATRYKLRTGKLPTAMPVTQDEASILNGRQRIVAIVEDVAGPVPQFMGIDLYPCVDAMQRRESLR